MHCYYHNQIAFACRDWADELSVSLPLYRPTSTYPPMDSEATLLYLRNTCSYRVATTAPADGSSLIMMASIKFYQCYTLQLWSCIVCVCVCVVCVGVDGECLLLSRRWVRRWLGGTRSALIRRRSNGTRSTAPHSFAITPADLYQLCGFWLARCFGSFLKLCSSSWCSCRSGLLTTYYLWCSVSAAQISVQVGGWLADWLLGSDRFFYSNHSSETALQSNCSLFFFLTLQIIWVFDGPQFCSFLKSLEQVFNARGRWCNL